LVEGWKVGEGYEEGWKGEICECYEENKEGSGKEWK
jgi:hypothetical protein